MTTNPFVAVYETPVESLTDAGYGLLLLGALIMSWWALGRNALYLQEEWRNGWLVLVPFWYAVRTVAALIGIAVDLWLVAALIAILT